MSCHEYTSKNDLLRNKYTWWYVGSLMNKNILEVAMERLAGRGSLYM